MSQGSKFSESTPVLLPLPEAEVWLWRGWLPDQTAAETYQTLLNSVIWQQPELFIAGKMRKIPRRQAWYGDAQASYRYSGRRFSPLPWSQTLAELRHQVEYQCQASFNSVLVNHYCGGADSVGWHADDEPELGDQPVIASLSLGSMRRFVFKSRSGGQRLAVELHSGDLLLMAGNTQRYWLHALPKTRKPVGGRINLTFRKVQV